MRSAVKDALRALAAEGRVDKTLQDLVEALCAGYGCAGGEAKDGDINIHVNTSANVVAQILKLGGRIMTVISDFAAAVQGHFDSVATAIDGLAGDVQGLKDMIEKLQNTPGVITPEDQALLDQIQARAQEISSRVIGLDAMTPPVPPVEPVLPVEPLDPVEPPPPESAA